jgi:hypothetical protein
MRLCEVSPGLEGTHRSVAHTCKLHWLPIDHIVVVVIMAKSHAAVAQMLLLLMAALLLAVTSPAQAVSQHVDTQCLSSLWRTASTATAMYRMC